VETGLRIAESGFRKDKEIEVMRDE